MRLTPVSRIPSWRVPLSGARRRGCPRCTRGHVQPFAPRGSKLRSPEPGTPARRARFRGTVKAGSCGADHNVAAPEQAFRRTVGTHSQVVERRPKRFNICGVMVAREFTWLDAGVRSALCSDKAPQLQLVLERCTRVCVGGGVGCLCLCAYHEG